MRKQHQMLIDHLKKLVKIIDNQKAEIIELKKKAAVPLTEQEMVADMMKDIF